MKPITITDQDWDAFVTSHPCAHFLQLSAWGKLKQAYAWQVDRVTLTEGQQIVAGAQLLFRRLPFRLGTMAYLAMGPLTTEDAVGTLPVPSLQDASNLWNAIDACARRHRAAFLKWEPGILYHGTAPDSGLKPTASSIIQDFRPSPQTIQPPRTILINIDGDDETILARMNQGTRRKIRQSQKNGIRYYEGSKTDVDTFNRLMQTTGTRNQFGVHEPGYYQMMCDLFVPPGQAALFLAEHQGDPLAGIFVLAVGSTAVYLAGASADVKRNLMASYGIQWAAIQWAKGRGCQTYDLWGIPDEDEATLEAQFESHSDGLWGVYGFKRGWGGQIVRSEGAWDKVYNPLVYQAYKLAVRVQE